MKKKMIVAFMIGLIIGKIYFLFTVCIDWELKACSVYYAQYTPHKKGVEPVLMMILDNYDSIYKPELKQIKYHHKGYSLLYLYDDQGNCIGEYRGGADNSSWRYVYEDYKHERKIVFDKKFKITYIYDRKNDKPIEIDDQEEERIKKELYDLLRPLIDEQSGSGLDLQAEFDKKYHDKFN